MCCCRLLYFPLIAFSFCFYPPLLQLCSALDTAKKLIESTNSNVTVLSEKVEELEKVIKKEDSAIAEVRSIHSLLSQRIASFSDSQA